MKRSIHTLVSLLAVVLLTRPFDCFASGTAKNEQMECCLKAKCGSTAKADDCCKNTAPDDQLVVAKSVAHSISPAIITTTSAAAVVSPPVISIVVAPFRHPPPAGFLVALNLPLLI